MVSKTKRVLAVILTGMMAAAALTGCNGGSSGGSTTSTATSTAPAESAATDTSTAASTAAGEAKDIDAMTDTIKAKMKEEAAATDGKIKITFWCASDDRKFEKSRIDEFKNKYAGDGYEFDISVKAAFGEGEAGGKVLESPKDAADVFNFADDQLSSLVESKAIAPVIELYNSNVVANNSEETVKAYQINGTPYAFPKTSDNGYFLYYDKTVYPTEADVANLDDMIKKAGEKGKNVYFNLGNAWYNAAFYFSAGVKIEYDGTKQTTTFDTEEGFNAAKAMCHVAESQGKGFMGNDGGSGDNTAVAKGFKDGKLAAAVIGTWEGPAIKDAIGADNVGAAKLPTALIGGEQKQLESFGGYKLVGVNQFTKYPVTCQTLAYFLTNTESQIARYKERGLIPTDLKALEDSSIQTDPARKAISDQQPFSHGQGSSVSGKYWSTNIGGFGGEIVTAKGAIDDEKIKSSLKSIQTQIDT
jgi:arabinogalactan oligomer/maltooligosaccharide transport system substrate-binding protein